MSFSNDNKNIAENLDINFASYTELPNNNPLVIVDYNMRIDYCNDSFKTNFGLGISDSINDMKSNPELIYLIQGLSASKYKNITVDINLSSEVDEAIKSYSITLERVLVKGNQYFMLIIESLEQRKKLENRVNALHNALDHGKLPIIILDHQFRISYATTAFEYLLSKEIETIYHQPIDSVLKGVLDSEDLIKFCEALQKSESWKRVIAINGSRQLSFWEFTLSSVSLQKDKEPRFILTASNLTEHINQTKTIERSERKQKQIINNISDLLLIIEKHDEKILFENANDNFCNFFGIDKNLSHLVKLSEVINEDLDSLIIQSINQITYQNRNSATFTFLHENERHFSCKVTHINEKISTIFIITMTDKTDEINYQEQLKKAYQKEMMVNKMKSDFLANMSHEIRTPFNAIIGYSEIIDESVAENDIKMVKEIMDSMKEVLGRALNLFTNIVEVSQIEAGEVELENVELNCNQVVRSVYNKNYEEVIKKNLEFKLDLDESECIVEIDWIKLEKVLNSLIDNATKYTPTGTIYIGTKNQKDKIEIIVADSGVGIEQSQIDRVLKPFSQEVEGYTRPYEGAGLGLTIAYRLTKLMNGDFDIISEKNLGTKVILSFPHAYLTSYSGGK